MNADFDQALNWAIAPRSPKPLAPYQQNLMSLSAGVELLKIVDVRDVAIVVLEGHGTLTLAEAVVLLEPGTLVFIPAELTHTLRTQTHLTFLLSRSSPDIGSSEAAWVVSL